MRRSADIVSLQEPGILRKLRPSMLGEGTPRSMAPARRLAPLQGQARSLRPGASGATECYCTKSVSPHRRSPNIDSHAAVPHSAHSWGKKPAYPAAKENQLGCFVKTSLRYVERSLKFGSCEVLGANKLQRSENSGNSDAKEEKLIKK